jgi:flagellar biosynthesis/type III secretory pathway chaperone
LDAQRRRIEAEADPKAAKEMRTGFNRTLSSLLKKCSDINTVNGGIVEISKQFNQRMLSTILGTPADEGDLYNAEGNNSANKLKQIFAKI